MDLVLTALLIVVVTILNRKIGKIIEHSKSISFRIDKERGVGMLLRHLSLIMPNRK